MLCFSIDYEYTKNGAKWQHHATLVDASNIKYAGKKLARKHKVKRVEITDWHIVGYY